MRLLITTGIFPPDLGGPATYVATLARALGERGHEVTVLTLGDPGTGAGAPGARVAGAAPRHQEEGNCFRVVRIPRGRFKPVRILETMAAAVRLGRTADVIYVNGLWLEAVPANNIVLRKPLVMKVVGDLAWERSSLWGWTGDSFEEFQQRRHGPAVEVLKGLRSWWTSRADRVIVPSRYLARWVAGWGVAGHKISVVYNSLDLPPVQPAPAPLDTPLRLITVGRLLPQKGIEGIVEALPHLPGAGLVVVGDGPHRAQLEAAASRWGVQDRVWFAGRRSHEETLSLMAAGHVFVLNSTYEGLPHSLLEAMGLGLPVVATAVGGVPEVVEDGRNGILVPPGDAAALARALAALASSEERRAVLGAAARETAARFSVARMVAETEEVLMAAARGVSQRRAGSER